MVRRTSIAVVEPQEQVQKEQSSHWFRIHRGVHTSEYRRVLESNMNSHNQTSRMLLTTHSRQLPVRKERGMNVKVEVGGMTRETRAVQERSEETVNRMVAVEEEVIEAVAMTGITVVREIIAMVAIRTATGTVPVGRMIKEMATARTVTTRTATRMATGMVPVGRMVEETVHRMAGMIVEETNIPRPIPVNIAALAQKETESAFRSSESSISFGLLFF